MEYLRTQFDEEIDSVDELEVKDGVFELGGEFIRPSEALRELRREVYDYAFQEWCDNRESTLIKEADKVLKEFENEDRFDKLLRSYSNGNMVPFVGAGMAYDSGYPLWDETLKRLARHSKVTEDQVDEHLEKGEYEECAQLVHDELRAALFNEKLGAMFGRKKSAVGAINLLPRLFPDTSIITTNFDTLTESVFDQHDAKQLRTIKTGSHLNEVIRQIAGGERILLKIHGHCDQVADRVLLKSEYDTAYNDQGVVQRFFDKVMFGRPMLFLGCSLYTDRTIKAMQDFVKENDADHVPRHYAFVELKDDDDRGEREAFLSDANIFPIWFGEDQFDLIEAFMTKLFVESDFSGVR